jgi:hypothetical protein
MERLNRALDDVPSERFGRGGFWTGHLAVQKRAEERAERFMKVRRANVILRYMTFHIIHCSQNFESVSAECYSTSTLFTLDTKSQALYSRNKGAASRFWVNSVRMNH